MRWVLYVFAGLGGLVALAIVVLLAIGGGRGESRLVRSVEISRPAEVVFTWISEPERLESWVGWLVEIKTLTPPPTAVGSRNVWVMEDRNNNNQRMDIETEVTRLEPNRLLEARLSVQAGFTGTVLYELQPIDAYRTHLTYRATYHFDHWLAKLLEPVISRSAQQKLNEDLDRLKQKAESESE
jgi:uncharacterized membrane protein